MKRFFRSLFKWLPQGDAEPVILDFFAGSGTTGHAVVAQNLEDGGTRRFILVQLPEKLNPESKAEQAAAARYAGADRKADGNIAELTKERLRQGIMQKQKPDGELYTGDLGFASSSSRRPTSALGNRTTADLENSLLKNAEHLVHGRSEQDVLYELLLKLGLDLCVPIEAKSIAGKTVHSIGGGALIVCLADGLTKDVIEPLSAGIVAWIKGSPPPSIPRRIQGFGFRRRHRQNQHGGDFESERHRRRSQLVRRVDETAFRTRPRLPEARDRIGRRPVPRAGDQPHELP